MELYFALFIHLIAIINSVYLSRVPVALASSSRAGPGTAGVTQPETCAPQPLRNPIDGFCNRFPWSFHRSLSLTHYDPLEGAILFQVRTNNQTLTKNQVTINNQVLISFHLIWIFRFCCIDIGFDELQLIVFQSMRISGVLTNQSIHFCLVWVGCELVFECGLLITNMINECDYFFFLLPLERSCFPVFSSLWPETGWNRFILWKMVWKSKYQSNNGHLNKFACLIGAELMWGWLGLAGKNSCCIFSQIGNGGSLIMPPWPKWQPFQCDFFFFQSNFRAVGERISVAELERFRGNLGAISGWFQKRISVAESERFPGDLGANSGANFSGGIGAVSGAISGRFESSLRAVREQFLGEAEFQCHFLEISEQIRSIFPARSSCNYEAISKLGAPFWTRCQHSRNDFHAEFISQPHQSNFRAISEQFQSNFRAIAGQLQGNYRAIEIDSTISIDWSISEPSSWNSEWNIPGNRIDFNLNEDGKELVFYLRRGRKEKNPREKKSKQREREKKPSQMWKEAKNFTEIGFPFGHIFVIASFLPWLLSARSLSLSLSLSLFLYSSALLHSLFFLPPEYRTRRKWSSSPHLLLLSSFSSSSSSFLPLSISPWWIWRQFRISFFFFIFAIDSVAKFTDFFPVSTREINPIHFCFNCAPA